MLPLKLPRDEGVDLEVPVAAPVEELLLHIEGEAARVLVLDDVEDRHNDGVEICVEVLETVMLEEEVGAGHSAVYIVPEPPAALVEPCIPPAPPVADRRPTRETIALSVRQYSATRPPPPAPPLLALPPQLTQRVCDAPPLAVMVPVRSATVPTRT